MMLFLILYQFLVAERIALWLDIVPPKDTFSSLSTIQIISAIFIAPVIEESVCRYHLSNKKKGKWMFIIMLALSPILLSNLGIITIVLLVIITLFSLITYKKWKNYINDKLFIPALLISSLLFSLFHVSLIKSGSIINDIIMAIVAFFPFAVSQGMLIKRSNLLTVILFHSCYNSLILVFNDFTDGL